MGVPYAVYQRKFDLLMEITEKLKKTDGNRQAFRRLSAEHDKILKEIEELEL